MNHSPHLAESFSSHEFLSGRTTANNDFSPDLTSAGHVPSLSIEATNIVFDNRTEDFEPSRSANTRGGAISQFATQPAHAFVDLHQRISNRDGNASPQIVAESQQTDRRR